VIAVMALSFIIAHANDDLVHLYKSRLAAETDDNISELLSIDKQLADYYLSVSDFEKAKMFLENIAANTREPQLTDIKLDLYRLDIIQSNFGRAESGLINVYFYSNNREQKARSAYLLGILNSLQGDYESARDYLTQSLKLRGLWTVEFESKLDSIMTDTKKRKNIETAKWLSTFLPGAGQIYAKNVKGAVGAIGIAAFWGGWFVYDLVQQDYYSAALVLLWPWQRYHRGNIQNAGYSAQDYNAKIEDGINRALLDYLSTK
jgi:hypothetical protein